jgi:Tfp pilus assembly protein PilV
MDFLMNQFSGFSFIEIMISLFIMSLLLLGFDAMQIVSLRESKSVYYFSVASQQLQNMIERLEFLQGADHAKQLTLWNQQNKAVLPQGRGMIEGSFPNYLITLYWGNSKNFTCLKNKMGPSGCLRFSSNS